MRSSLALIALILVACGGSGPTGVTPPPPPPIATVPDQVIGSTGGTVTVNLPDTPIDGMTIAIPSGTFPGSQTIGISYAANTGFPHPTGTTLLSPWITVKVSDGRIASKAMQVTIPVSVPAGVVPMVILRDPTTGRHQVLPTVSYSETSVTAITGHFNGSKLFRRGSATSLQEAGMLDPASKTGLAVIGVPDELLSQDHDTGFRPGVDSWEFAQRPTILGIWNSSGMAATQAWYYVEQKSGNGALWKKYQEADGVEESNRRGLRWAAVTEIESFNAIYGALNSLIEELTAAGKGSQLPIRSFYSIQAALMDTPDVPQLVVIMSADLSLSLTLLVYKSSYRTLYAVNPDNPGQTLVLDFSSGSMAPYQPSWAAVPFTRFAAPGFSILNDMNNLDDDWDEVQGGTIGDAEFPTFRPMIAWGHAVGESTPLIGPAYAFAPSETPIEIWADCISCVGVNRPADFPSGSAKVAMINVWAKVSTTLWQDLGTSESVESDLPAIGTGTAGAAVFTGRPNDANLYWTDWLPLTLKRLAATIAPVSPTGVAGDFVDLTLSITGAPGNLEYVWDFGDGPLVTTTTLATSHKWSTSGTYSVKVTARDKTTKQPVAKASTSAQISAGIQAWKFTTASASFTLSQPPAVQNNSYDARWSVDSQIIRRIALGITQGGIRFVDQVFTPTGFPPRSAPIGLYLLEGASLTLSNLQDPATTNTFTVATFPNASLTIAAAPQVSGWNLVQAAAPVNPLCNTYGDTYNLTGTTTGGHLTALRIPLCVQSIILPTINGQRLMSMSADVTFGATTAAGTITITYYFYGDGLPSQSFERTATLTFTATRL